MKNIISLEIDLIDACNLSCPLCNRSRHISKDGYIDISEWIDIINSYENLNTIYFLGTRSEHTLYPQFLELIKFIKHKSINIILSTNGDTHNLEWWRELGIILNENDEVRFAIDGITQEVYETYRVGGSLSNVLKNWAAFKNESNHDCIQYIKFDHNKHEDIKHMIDLFSNSRIINSSFSAGIIRPTDEYMLRYKILDATAKRVSPDITCETKNNQHFINYKGQVSPCCHYNEHLVLNGKSWDKDYDKIEKGEYDFCTKICDKKCKAIRKEFDIEL